ncbi:MAG: beta-ketoacyl-[acyl-carrier-protein] synthase family protein [Bacteroidota bacterium]
MITGAGVVSPIGTGVDAFWQNCLQGKTTVTPIPAQWERYADLHSRIWAPLPDIDPESLGVARAERLQLDPIAMLALGAAREAIARAGFTLMAAGERSRNFILSGTDASRAGVYLGTGIGGAYTFLHNHAHHLLQRARASLAACSDNLTSDADHETVGTVLELMSHGPRYNPFVVSMLMPNAASAAVGIKFSLTGPNLTYCVACASGTVAVGHGYKAVSEGQVDIAVTGGSEYLYDEHGHIFRGFDIARTLVHDYTGPETANRPFDENRSGFLFSQGGAAVLVLEELEHAQRRGATIMAELTGFAETFDAHSMMSLAHGGEQIERMIRAALADAGVTPNDVDYVNAHGTGTKINDEIEADVIERVFGKSVRVNSTKSLIGHTIGASGAFEALVTALSLRDGTTHICKNLETPLRDLNFVRRVEQCDLRVGLSQSFAFGGHNAAVVIERFN